MTNSNLINVVFFRDFLNVSILYNFYVKSIISNINETA